MTSISIFYVPNCICGDDTSVAVAILMQLTWVLWALGLFIVSVNTFFICDSLVVWISKSKWPATYLVPLVIISGAALWLYIGAILFLAFRPDVENTFGLIYEEARSGDGDLDLGTLNGDGKEIEIVSMSKFSRNGEDEDKEFFSPRHLDSANVTLAHAHMSIESVDLDEEKVWAL